MATCLPAHKEKENEYFFPPSRTRLKKDGIFREKVTYGHPDYGVPPSFCWRTLFQLLK